MATASFSSVFVNPPLSPNHSKTRTNPTFRSITKAQSQTRKEDIVVVGAGIAGLATAVSLHRFDLLNIIDQTPDDTIIRTPLVDRWLWPAISPPASSGRVVLVGDAWHPMTPNLGQGACCALEDAVVLARKLASAVKSGSTPSVEEAMSSYGSERWPRVFPLTIRANLVGSVLQWENPIVCSVRNNVVIPKLVRLGPLLEHTNFECQPLV